MVIVSSFVVSGWCSLECPSLCCVLLFTEKYELILQASDVGDAVLPQYCCRWFFFFVLGGFPKGRVRTETAIDTCSCETHMTTLAECLWFDDLALVDEWLRKGS